MVSPLAPFRRALAEGALRALGLPASEAAALERHIRVPDRDHGDLALACFELAKQQGQNPVETARTVAAALVEGGPWAAVAAAGPYVNVTLAAARLAEAVVPAARAPGYGEGDEGAGKTVVIDFSSPNIAKPLAFHHVRSTVIGAALHRLHAARGFKVVGINYLGDWGKQFGLLATGFRRYGDPARRADAKHLVEVYVKANRDADVAGLEQQVAAPAAQRALVAALHAARAELPALEGKARKKADKQVKGLERKLRQARGLAEDRDPLEGLEAWYAELERVKAEAEARLPEARERDREARVFLRRLEEGDAEARAEWHEFRETSIAEFDRVYARMGVAFESTEGESFYTDVLEQTIERVAQKPGVRLDNGALVVDLPYAPGEPPILLKTRDGTTLYVTRDIAAAIDRHARFAFDRSLYVVATDQSLHFAQLVRTLGAMGFAWADAIHHVAFGRVHGMSTRRGNVVFLDEVLDEAVSKAREICRGGGRIPAESFEETVEAIGVGAVVFGDLKNLRASDYTFRWDDVVNFEGASGPYVQYTHARCHSILDRAGGAPTGEAELSLLTHELERQVLMRLSEFPDAVARACESFEPSLVTRCLLELSQAVSSYFTAGNQEHALRILVDDAKLRAARLSLVDAVRQTLESGLALLGLRAPPTM